MAKAHRATLALLANRGVPSAAKRPALAYLALGSNLGDRVDHVVKARDAIGVIPGCSLQRCSSLFETAAWGSNTPQPDYLNAVIAVETTLTPLQLWQHTSAIEQAQGRVRNAEKNAARTLDIDLLLYDDIITDTSRLTLPHPRMHLRKFVLQPLLEIAPHIVIPERGAAANCLLKIADDDARKLSHNSAWN